MPSGVDLLEQLALPDLRISHLSKHFGEVVAVDDMMLDVAEGTLVTFLGPSGCGKTTTLRMIAGLESPSSGTIDIGERRVCGDGRAVPTERRRIGMVFQSYAIWPHLSVFENVAYPLRIARVARADVAMRVTSALATVQLGQFADRHPATLSGGQQQRVALARAIVAEPQLLLFDEPLSNLDTKLREQMRREIRELQLRLGLTAVYVTHDQQEALAISDLVAVMSQGRIVQCDRPREICEHPVDRYVADFVGWTNCLPAKISPDGDLVVGDRRFRVDRPLDPSEDASVEIMSRPDDVQVTPGAVDAENTLTGDLVGAFYAGRDVLCDIVANGRTIQGYARPDAELEVGMPVSLRFPPDKTLCFPPD